MYQAFRECGASAFLTLLLALVATVLGLVSVAMASANARGALSAAMAAFAMVVLVAASGVVGTLLGRSAVEAAIATVAPEHREAIRTAGYAEAAQCTRVAGGADALPTVLAIVALVLATRGRNAA